jgi:hypothetical protein
MKPTQFFYVMAHQAVVGRLGLASIIGVRLRPDLAPRIHRPSASHMVRMLATAALAALALHIIVHSGGVAWT